MKKVLVIEDDPLSMELVVGILKAQGFSEDEAFDGTQAIRMAEKEIYDLIIMDIALPGMDGVEVKTVIKSKPQYKKVPVIALTAYAMKGDRERFFEAGFDEYISKPIDVDNFMKIIEKYSI